MQKPQTAKMAVDADIQSVSDAQNSKESMRNSGLRLSEIHDIKLKPLDRNQFTRQKLQFVTHNPILSEPGLSVQAGACLELYKSWQCCVETWLNISGQRILNLQYGLNGLYLLKKNL